VNNKMRIFSVSGISKSGKTTTIEEIIKELRRRRYTVGSIKDIHFEAFAIDGPSTNTARHRRAGSELVTAWGLAETDVLFPTRLPLEQLLRFYSQDFVIIEGFAEGPIPKIVTGHSLEQVDERLDDLTFAISGRIAAGMDEYRGLPALSALTQVAELCDLIEEKVFERLPHFPGECCAACGQDCVQLAARILKGEAQRSDCRLVAERQKVELCIDDEPIKMVPFVQSILYNAVRGVVTELDGYQPGKKVEIKIGSI
jgi:molybdopterin-guanine dinucleotide biosynthesis protein B